MSSKARVIFKQRNAFSFIAKIVKKFASFSAIKMPLQRKNRKKGRRRRRSVWDAEAKGKGNKKKRENRKIRKGEKKNRKKGKILLQ
jgi:hypothetical protein